MLPFPIRFRWSAGNQEGGQTGWQLVFINCCSTRLQVQLLPDAGVSVVIATTQTIDDSVAIDFDASFYQSLASDYDAGISVEVSLGS